jgi:hypothetical protein
MSEDFSVNFSFSASVVLEKKIFEIFPYIKNVLFVCFILSRTSNFSAIWRLSPLPATGLQI